MTNFRHKLDSKEDIATEGVVGLFCSAWNEQQSSAVFCNDQLPDAMARTGEALVRLYMQQAAPSIQPASIEQPFQGVLGMVRIRGQVDIVDVDGTIIDIVTATSLPARIDTMHRFELGTCARLTHGASGVVRSGGEHRAMVAESHCVNGKGVNAAEPVGFLPAQFPQNSSIWPNSRSFPANSHRVTPLFVAGISASH